jgi:L-asparaginase / beta-aspartyl-peptidase
MKIVFLLAFGCFFSVGFAQTGTRLNNRFVLVIHGGAGTILKENMTPEKEQAYHEALRLALQKGYDTLQKGASALDAVTTAVMILEDSPLFNAGKGAVFTNQGINELDAAIMNGKTLAAGSVAGVTTVKNPVTAARAVMEKSNHVMLTGKGAEQFATEAGCVIVEPGYFFTEERWQGLQKAKKADSLEQMKKNIPGKAGAMLRQNAGLDSAALAREMLTEIDRQIASVWQGDAKFGTVGAVALDRHGNLAAATSTGGMTNKKWGRVGDAPIIGAGTYANNATCAISCTGWGEYFIRLVVAKTISDMIAFSGGKKTLDAAAQEVVMKQVPALGGDGGLIGVDNKGNITMPFNTAGMYRGHINEAGTMVTGIYKDGMEMEASKTSKPSQKK